MIQYDGAASGMRVEPEDHICALVAGRTQRNGILRPFLSEGLAAGHKCLLGLAEPDPWPTVHELLPDAAACERQRSAGQLEALGSEDPQFSPESFSIPAMLQFWTTVTDEARASGYDFARLTAEARWWSPQLPHGNALIDYESSLNTFVRGRGVAILCVYDLMDYSWMTVDLVRTHRRVLINDIEVVNPYYVPPEELRPGRAAAVLGGPEGAPV